MDQLDALVARARTLGIQVLALKPPLPERVRRRLPDELQFDRLLKETLSNQ
jgi:hypothetical protein